MDFREDLFVKARLCRSGKYIQANGVKMYYETYGHGEPLLLFHGGLSTLDTFRYQIFPLSKHYQVILPERPGHGHSADRECDFSYAQMADDMIAFMDELKISNAKMLGYSDGANLILDLALKRPELIERFISVGGNFHHKGCVEAFQQELREIPEDSVGEGIDRNYIKYSPDDKEHYAAVFSKARKLWLTEPTFEAKDLSGIQSFGLIMAGDQDVISVEHSVEFYRALPKAQLFIVPGTSHGLLKEKPEWVNQSILDFLKQEIPEGLPE